MSITRRIHPLLDEELKRKQYELELNEKSPVSITRASMELAKDLKRKLRGLP